jgi:hypothetical protein
MTSKPFRGMRLPEILTNKNIVFQNNAYINGIRKHSKLVRDRHEAVRQQL